MIMCVVDDASGDSDDYIITHQETVNYAKCVEKDDENDGRMTFYFLPVQNNGLTPENVALPERDRINPTGKGQPD